MPGEGGGQEGEAGGCGRLLHARPVCAVLVPGHRWDQRPGSWLQSGHGHLLCLLGWTCATGARSSQWLGRSSSECGCVWSRLSPPVSTAPGPGPRSALRSLRGCSPNTGSSGTVELCPGFWGLFLNLLVVPWGDVLHHRPTQSGIVGVKDGLPGPGALLGLSSPLWCPDSDLGAGQAWGSARTFREAVPSLCWLTCFVGQQMRRGRSASGP